MELTGMREDKVLQSFSDEMNEVFQNVAIALILVDTEGYIANINRTGIDLFGKKDTEVLGVSLGEAFGCARERLKGEKCFEGELCKLCDVGSRVTDAFRTGRSFYGEKVQMVVGNEAETKIDFQISLAKVCIRTEDYVLITLEERTSPLVQKEQLEELLAVKDKFLSIIAHDLRSPFSTILGLSELLTERIDDYSLEMLRDVAQTIHSSGQRAYELLENLLKWSKSQGNSIEFNPELLSLKVLVDSVMGNYRAYAKQKNIQLHNEVVRGISINADEPMLRTIFRNLIHNAVKFTYPGGAVSVCALKKGSVVEIMVRDTGVGMSSVQLQELFRLDKSTTTFGTNKEQGSGLGLLLCKEFIERHNGNISVESEQGVGTCFLFSIPSII